MRSSDVFHGSVTARLLDQLHWLADLAEQPGQSRDFEERRALRRRGLPISMMTVF